MISYLKQKIENYNLYIEGRVWYWFLILLGIVFIVVGSIINPTRTQSKFVKYDLIEDIDIDDNIHVTVTFGNKQKKFDINRISAYVNNKYVNKNEKTIKIEYDPNNEENFAYFSSLFELYSIFIILVWIFIILGIIAILLGLISLLMDDDRFDPIDLGFVNFMNIFDY